MPGKKCVNDKYKWGNTGECKYATKEACEKANPKNYKEMKNKPTPLGKKTYEEYAKELKEFNLSAEPKLTKVELGLIDDLKKYNQGVDKYENEGDGLLKRGKRLLSELKETQEAIFKWSAVGKSIKQDMTGDFIKIDKQAKELGIDPLSIKERAVAAKTYVKYEKLGEKYEKEAKELIK